MRRRSRSIGRGIAQALWLGALASPACAPGDRGPPDAPGTAALERLNGDVERNLVAVMPFNVSGAEDTLAYLADALPDLLSRKLNHRDPPRVVFDATDLESARRQALDAGAGGVVMGAVVGNAGRLTIRATYRLTKSGRIMADESVSGQLDSLDALTSRLALQLALWGVDPAAREMIRSAPPAVIDATLDGRLALVVEDGRTAADAFQAALVLDSTFGIAAEGLYDVATNVRANPGLDEEEVTRLVQSLLPRTTAAFRAWMEADQDPDSTRRPTVLEDIRRFEAAAAAYPTHPWILNRLAYLYHWDGAYAGIEDWYSRAARAFRQADENLGMAPCEADNQLIPRQTEPDPRVLSEYAESCRPEDRPNAFQRNFFRLQKAAILGDTAELRRIRNSAAIDSIGARTPYFLFYFVQPGFGLREWRAGIEASERAAATEGQRVYVLDARFHLARVMGRPAEASAYLREVLASGLVGDPWWDLSYPIESALLEPGWEEMAAEAGYRTVNPDPAWGDTLPRGPPGWNNSFDRLCHAELARLAGRDTSQTRRSVATLRHLRESAVPRTERACPELLDALRESLSADPGTRALARLDSISSLAPGRDEHDRIMLNLVLARLYWARGDTAAAWKWVRRRAWTQETAGVLPAWLRSEGRFAAAVGEREHAIRAYRQYLILREDPEPVLVPQRDSVLAELACLDPEFADRGDPAVCAELP